MRPVTTHFPLSPPRGICQLILSRDNNHFLRDRSSNLKENCQKIIKKKILDATPQIISNNHFLRDGSSNLKEIVKK